MGKVVAVRSAQSSADENLAGHLGANGVAVAGSGLLGGPRDFSGSFPPHEADNAVVQLIQSHLERIFRGLAESRTQAQHLKAAMELGQPKGIRRVALLHSGKDGPVERRMLMRRDTDQYNDSPTVDKFFDCRSSVSTLTGEYESSMTSPDGYFETKSSFYPEQYSLGSIVQDPIFVFAIVQSPDDY